MKPMLQDPLVYQNPSDLGSGDVSVEVLADHVRIGPTSVAEAAADALAELGVRAAPALPALVEGLRLQEEEDEHPERFLGVNDALAAAFTAIGPAAVPYLVAALQDAEPRVRYKAAVILGRLPALDTDAALALARLLQDADAWVRLEAARTLNTLPSLPMDAAYALSAATQDPHVLVRSAIELALSSRTPGRGFEVPVQELIQCLQQDDPRLRAKAADMLGGLGQHALPALPALLLALDDRTNVPPLEVIDALSRLAQQEPSALSLLEKVLRGANEEHAGYAAMALSRVGPAAARAAADLRALLSSRIAWVSRSARLALESLAPDPWEAFPQARRQDAPQRRHVRQRSTHDCALAAAAMAAGVSYENAQAALPDKMPRLGLTLEQMVPLLEKLTKVAWRYTQPWTLLRPWFVRLRNLTIPRDLVVLFIRHPWCFWRSHSVVVHDGMIHDPGLPEPIRREQYPLRHWRVYGVMEPTAEGFVVAQVTSER